MNNMVVLQHTTIKASFRKNINVVEHKFNTPVYKLHDFVSREAQDLIYHELQWVNTVVLIFGIPLRSVPLQQK